MAPGPQLGNGTIAVYDTNGAGPLAYLGSFYSGGVGFREVIVAKRGTLFAPIHVATHKLTGLNVTYPTPSHAENEFLGFLGAGSRRDVDRWWVESGPVARVDAFPNPPNSYSFYQVAGARDPKGNVVSLWAQFVRPGAAGRIDSLVFIARQPGEPPSIVPHKVKLFGLSGVSVSAGAVFEGIAKAQVGEFERWVVQDSVRKVLGAFPDTWADEAVAD